MENDSIEETDIITRLGYLCLGSRLKRLGERMQAGVAQVLAEQESEVQPAQLPLLMALAEDEALTIGALSMKVGISQPGISRALVPLEVVGLVEASSQGKDRRQRLIGLTEKGRLLIADLQGALFPAVQQAVTQLCAGGAPDFLAEVMRIEEGLRQEALDMRIKRVAGELGRG